MVRTYILLYVYRYYTEEKYKFQTTPTFQTFIIMQLYIFGVLSKNFTNHNSLKLIPIFSHIYAYFDNI